MKHRHLDYPPDTPVEELPSAALVDLLERGDLSDWRPVVVAIARDPYGDLADRVLELVDRFPMYGTSPLLRAWIERARASARPPELALPLAILRRHVGLTQTQLARRVGMTQSDLSKFERRRDVRLSTLRNYVEALGGRLSVVAELPGTLVEVTLGAGNDHRPRSTSGAASHEIDSR